MIKVGVTIDNMKKDLIFTFILFLIQCVFVTTKGFSYPLLLLFFILGILTYISIIDWRTGLISVELNILVLVLSILYAVFSKMPIKTIGINLLCFVLPFILIEAIFQLFINRGKDPEKFMVGGGDILLFAGMSMILSTFNMMIMLFFACLFSLITSKVINKSLIHFAPFIQIGLLIALLI